MGYGVAYGTAPFGFVDPPEVTGDPVRLHSSRRITADGEYVIESTGEIAGMDDVQQRVVLVCSFAIAEPPPFIDPKALRLIEVKLRNALDATLGTDITIESVVASAGLPGRVRYEVVYRNNLVNTRQTVEGSL